MVQKSLLFYFQVENSNPGSVGVPGAVSINEDSNTSGGNVKDDMVKFYVFVDLNTWRGTAG